MKVLIIEDEEPAVLRLKKLIGQLDRQIEIVDCLDSVGASAQWLTTHASPDLIFMDIRLADGLSFEIYDLTEVKAPVIFTTAYNEYALKAFKVNSIDYLLKPVDPEELRNAVEKYHTRFSQSANEVPFWQENMQKLLGQFTGNYKTRFFIRVGQRYTSIPVEDIESFFVQAKCTFLMTTNGKMLAVDFSLDQLANRVDPALFFRANRNYLVNLHAIEEVVIYSGNRLKLKLKKGNYSETILVSRDRVSDFKQ